MRPSATVSLFTWVCALLLYLGLHCCWHISGGTDPQADWLWGLAVNTADELLFGAVSLLRLWCQPMGVLFLELLRNSSGAGQDQLLFVTSWGPPGGSYKVICSQLPLVRVPLVGAMMWAEASHHLCWLGDTWWELQRKLRPVNACVRLGAAWVPLKRNKHVRLQQTSVSFWYAIPNHFHTQMSWGLSSWHWSPSLMWGCDSWPSEVLSTAQIPHPILISPTKGVEPACSVSTPSIVSTRLLLYIRS